MMIISGIIILILLIAIVAQSVYINTKIHKSKDSFPVQRSVRRKIQDVKTGEYIFIESYKIKAKIGQVCCLNNDPTTKKILLEIKWNVPSNGLKTEKIILDYNDAELKNFHLLNEVKMIPNIIAEDDNNDHVDYDIARLQKEMNKALEEQRYEDADQLQKKIDLIMIKTKNN